jgi:hypothetical protein
MAAQHKAASFTPKLSNCVPNPDLAVGLYDGVYTSRACGVHELFSPERGCTGGLLRLAILPAGQNAAGVRRAGCLQRVDAHQRGARGAVQRAFRGVANKLLASSL